MTKILGTTIRTTIRLVAATLLALPLLAPSIVAARTAGPDCEGAGRAARADIEAACPCGGPGTHAEYVRCVTKKLRALTACTPDDNGKRTCGSVPRQCAAKVRRLASRSACGKPEATVTCCVPKQRDCEGDATPGDGKQDGTCTGTTRKCDRITECMVPRCELAATAERCGLVGGTVGTGRDCATACGE
jgi:hypothetical protein